MFVRLGVYKCIEAHFAYPMQMFSLKKKICVLVVDCTESLLMKASAKLYDMLWESKWPSLPR